MRTNDEVVWDIFKDIIALPGDEFAIFCECFSDDMLPAGCTAQVIEMAKDMRKIRVV